MNTRTYPLVSLHKKSEHIIALPREELKANFFFDRLAKAGLDDCPYQPYLRSVILSLTRFESCPDEVTDFYLNRLQHYTDNLKPDKGHQHLSKKCISFL